MANSAWWLSKICASTPSMMILFASPLPPPRRYVFQNENAGIAARPFPCLDELVGSETDLSRKSNRICFE
jgi:hypothetical protein